MKVLVCGDRNWNDENSIEACLAELLDDSYDCLVTGGCKGADMLAEKVASRLGFVNIKTYPANWERFGRAAGPIRNQEMLVKESPDLVLYFHNDLTKSRGTKHMVSIAIKKGIQVMDGLSYALSRNSH